MRMLQKLSLLLLLAGVGCAGGNSGSTTFDAGGRLDAATDSGIDGGSTESDSGTDAGVDAGPQGTMAINEIQSAGTDWIEVVNVSGGALDVSGWIITQADDAGDPEIDRGAVVPAGTALTAGQRIVVLNDMGGGEGWQTECEGLVDECLYADFGISASNGDTLFVLDADEEVMDEVLFEGGLEDAAQTFRRLPDGTGEFSAGTATPGTENEL